MSIPSSLQKNATPSVSNTPPAVLPRTKTDNWKLDLLAEFEVNHCDWNGEFNTLVQHYIFEDDTADGKPDRNLLLRGCLAHGGAKVLKTICEHEGIKSWCIEGPVKVGEWETLNESSKDGLPIESLKLSNMRFDSAAGATLFHVLGQLPALNSLILENVGFEGSTFLLSMRDCPPLERLGTLAVTALAEGFDVCPLLLKILEACQLRTLSIEECASITVDQHALLAKALGRQTCLSSLKLEISLCNTPEQFECYLRFLDGNVSITKLDLSGCDLGIRNCNLLLKVLGGKPQLARLSLQNCQLMNDPDSKDGPESERIRVQPLASMPGLLELDLSYNYLTLDTMVPLLIALEENRNTRLSALDLSGNPGLKASRLDTKDVKTHSVDIMQAVASLLKVNRTLLWLSLRRTAVPLIYSEDELVPLAEALNHNSSLLQLDLGQTVSSPTRMRLAGSLARNREILRNGAMRSGWQSLRSLLLLPELANRTAQELAPGDFLSLSSVNRDAWARRRQSSGE